MSKAKCSKCGGSAFGDTYEQARNKLNHSVGLSRGIKCGDSYGFVKEIKDPTKAEPKVVKEPKTEKPETVVEEVETNDSLYSLIEELWYEGLPIEGEGFSDTDGKSFDVEIDYCEEDE